MAKLKKNAARKAASKKSAAKRPPAKKAPAKKAPAKKAPAKKAPAKKAPAKKAPAKKAPAKKAPEGGEDATRAALRKLKLPAFERPSDLPALIRRKDFRRAGALIGGGAEVTEEVLELALRSAPPSFFAPLAGRVTLAQLGALLPSAGSLGRAEVVVALLDLGVDIETVDEDGATALARAFFFCRDEAVEVLLERGARGFGTAKQFGSYFKQENVAFAKKYADRLDWAELSTWVDSHGVYLLTSAVHVDDDEALEKFLAAGANAAADPNAMGVAVGRCNLACARLLDAAAAPLELPYNLAFGLVSTAINTDAPDATRAALVRLCHARGVRFPETVPEDKKSFFPGHTPGQLLRTAAERGYEYTCLALLAAGFPHEGETNGETALNYAAWNGLSRLVAALIERGMPACPEALCYAASAGRQSVVEQLLRADPTLLNASTRNSGETPLIGAAEQGRLEVVMFLLAHGADKSLTKKDGKTALDLARAEDHGAVVELLEG